MLLKKIQTSLDVLAEDAGKVSRERKRVLNPLIKYLKTKRQSGEPLNLLFVCTHNARRSQLAQAWATAIAEYYDIHTLKAFSGGTDVSACHPQTIAALRSSGFVIGPADDDQNPIYEVKYARDVTPMVLLSKMIASDRNPKENFIAIMTCESAETQCPIVPGADEKFSLTYPDPKWADNTKEMKKAYLEISSHIASELLYILQKI